MCFRQIIGVDRLIRNLVILWHSIPHTSPISLAFCLNQSRIPYMNFFYLEYFGEDCCIIFPFVILFRHCPLHYKMIFLLWSMHYRAWVWMWMLIWRTWQGKKTFSLEINSSLVLHIGMFLAVGFLISIQNS